MRNKLLLSLVLAAASSSVFAMPYEPMDHCGIFEVALTGGGFKTSTDNTFFGATGTATSPSSVLKNDPKYKFGGSVELGYYFPNSTINVDATWFGTRNKQDHSHTGSVVGLIIPPDDNFDDATSAFSNYNFNYDFVNLEVGSLTRVNLNGLILNPQVGLSYARIRERQNVQYNGTGAGGDEVAAVYRSSTFKGFGPSIGLELNYIVCLPVNLFGNIRYNALVGDVDSNGSFQTTAASASFSSDSDKSLVSLIQSELGIGYDFGFYDWFCGNIAVGYQLTKAIGAGERVSFVDSVSSTFVDNLYDTDIHGWFVRLTMDFDV